MSEHLYRYLAEWAKNNKVRFRVEHYDNCHLLHLTHVLNKHERGEVFRHVIVEYPHKGGRYILQPWVVDDVMDDFISIAEMFWTAIPKQPCSTLGYE